MSNLEEIPPSNEPVDNCGENEPQNPVVETPARIYTEEETEKYRRMIINFINGNKYSIAKIYLSHLEQDGVGIIVINLIETIYEKGKNYNVDVIFIKEEAVPPELLAKVNERREVNNSNIVYILMSTPAEQQIVELDIRNLTN